MDDHLPMPNETPSPKILLQTLLGKKTAQTPVWLMRQAGRYLPEYRELRAQKGGFLELCYDAEAAADVTMQPIRRFGFDGAILFSDILIVPHAMGQKLWFETGEGPRLAPRLLDATLASLEGAPEHFEAIYATVRTVAAQLDDKTPSWALPAVRGQSQPIWSMARAARTRRRRVALPIAMKPLSPN